MQTLLRTLPRKPQLKVSIFLEILSSHPVMLLLFEEKQILQNYKKKKKKRLIFHKIFLPLMVDKDLRKINFEVKESEMPWKTKTWSIGFNCKWVHGMLHSNHTISYSLWRSMEAHIWTAAPKADSCSLYLIREKERK